MQLRGAELDVPRAETAIAQARVDVTSLLSGNETVKAGDIPFGPGETFAMTVLSRRLGHILESARKVARLAARPVIHDQTRHA